MKTAVIFAFVYFVLVKSQEAIDELQSKISTNQHSIPASPGFLLQSGSQQQQQQTVQNKHKFQQNNNNNKKQEKRAIYLDSNTYGGGSGGGNYDPYYWNYVSPSTGIGYNPAFTRINNNFPDYTPTTIGYNPTAVTTATPNSWYPSIYDNRGLRYRNGYNYDPYRTRVIGLNPNGGYNSYNYNGYYNNYNNRLNGYRGGYNNNYYPTTDGGVGYTYGPGISAGYNNNY